MTVVCKKYLKQLLKSWYVQKKNVPDGTLKHDQVIAGLWFCADSSM